MYIEATIEKNRKSESIKIKNILIACSAGFATGRLLEAKIKARFDVNVVGVTSIHNINRSLLDNKNKIDYIISPVDINENYNIPIIKVSSILTEDDIEKLKDKLELKRAKEKIDEKYKTLSTIENENNKEINIEEIINLIEKNTEIINRDSLVNDLNSYFKKCKIYNYRNIELYKYISEDNIQLNLEVNSWE